MLGPPEGLRPRSYPGSTPGIDPRSQGVIPRRFKEKKNFVTNKLTNELTHGWTDRRAGGNSDLDMTTLEELFFSFLSIFKSLKTSTKMKGNLVLVSQIDLKPFFHFFYAAILPFCIVHNL